MLITVSYEVEHFMMLNNFKNDPRWISQLAGTWREVNYTYFVAFSVTSAAINGQLLRASP